MGRERGRENVTFELASYSDYTAPEAEVSLCTGSETTYINSSVNLCANVMAESAYSCCLCRCLHASPSINNRVHYREDHVCMDLGPSLPSCRAARYAAG